MILIFDFVCILILISCFFLLCFVITYHPFLHFISIAHNHILSLFISVHFHNKVVQFLSIFFYCIDPFCIIITHFFFCFFMKTNFIFFILRFCLSLSVFILQSQLLWIWVCFFLVCIQPKNMQNSIFFNKWLLWMNDWMIHFKMNI